MSNAYDIIQRQRKERNLLQREMESEERYLHILSLTYTETCQSRIGKSNAQSIAQQINLWQKTLTESQKKNKLLLVELNDSFHDFKEYILEKYKSNTSKLNEFEALFDQEDYKKDCKRIMIHKIYDYKLNQSIKDFEDGFISPRAHSIAIVNQEIKKVRKFAHEAVNSTYRRLNAPKLPDSIENMIYENIQRIFNNYFTNENRVQALSNNLENKNHLRLIE